MRYCTELLTVGAELADGDRGDRVEPAPNPNTERKRTSRGCPCPFRQTQRPCRVIRERAVARIRRRIGSSHKMGVPEMFPIPWMPCRRSRFKL